jgi:DMSO/TMAO reductase YedYZ molybdopterin-dependent catalytic subunit
VSAGLFRHGHFAPTFSEAELTPFDKFPINDYDVDDPGVDVAHWSLAVSGAVQKSGNYILTQFQQLPKFTQNTRHVCVEGWDVIGNFAGTRLSDFLKLIGADTTARFITVKCADDYYESLDMATALHPQTLLCYEMYGQPLTREHGAPLRLSIPTKIGYKQAKWLTEMSVTNVLQQIGYWEDQGYSEYYGL